MKIEIITKHAKTTEFMRVPTVKEYSKITYHEKEEMKKKFKAFYKNLKDYYHKGLITIEELMEEIDNFLEKL